MFFSKQDKTLQMIGLDGGADDSGFHLLTVLLSFSDASALEGSSTLFSIFVLSLASPKTLSQGQST